MLIYLTNLFAPLVHLKRDWRFRLQRTFFGLSDKYQQDLYEQFFLMKYHGGWSFIESYNLPVGLRNWFLKRLADQLKNEADQIEKAQKR
jgi:hypothetical protein